MIFGLPSCANQDSVNILLSPTLATALPRLACALILESRWEDFLALLGVCCSTFVGISRGSTHRSDFLPTGCPVSMAVYKANKGLCRRVLDKGNSLPSNNCFLFQPFEISMFTNFD